MEGSWSLIQRWQWERLWDWCTGSSREASVSDCCSEERATFHKCSWALGTHYRYTRPRCCIWSVSPRLAEVLRTDLAQKRVEIQRAFVTNKITLVRTWEVITGTISKCTANWMGCIGIYKITLSQCFLDSPNLTRLSFCQKSTLGIFQEELHRYAGKRTSGQLEKWWMDAFLLSLS